MITIITIRQFQKKEDKVITVTKGIIEGDI